MLLLAHASILIGRVVWRRRMRGLLYVRLVQGIYALLGVIWLLLILWGWGLLRGGLICSIEGGKYI